MPISLPSRLKVGLPTWPALLILVAALSVACGPRPQAGNATAPTPQPAAASASPIPWKTIEPPPQVGAPAGATKAQERTPVRTFNGAGVIRSVNLNDGWFEIDHEDIAGYMPAMRMQWSVKDKSMLNSVRAGDRVNFKLREDNGSEVITELKKISERE